MKKLIAAIFTFGILTSFFACSSSSEPEAQANGDSSTVATPAPIGVGGDPAGATPANIAINPTGEAPQAASSAAPASGGINPAHGQPGHRCDIPEGAPLNSAPAQGGQAQTPSLNATNPINTAAPPSFSTPNPAGNAPQPVAAPTQGSGKPNPEHGAPGHDCSVPVGSPLPN